MPLSEHETLPSQLDCVRSILPDLAARQSQNGDLGCLNQQPRLMMASERRCIYETAALDLAWPSLKLHQ